MFTPARDEGPDLECISSKGDSKDHHSTAPPMETSCTAKKGTVTLGRAAAGDVKFGSVIDLTSM